jgi:diaminopimelate epimerase
MEINFFKYQGAGNDFLIIDDREEKFDRTNIKLIKSICNRRFGIGADGLMLLRSKKGFDFEMVYYNSDGNESSMCGNGGRCIVSFAKKIGVIGDRCHFLAVDGPHEANSIYKEDGEWISLKMIDVDHIEKGPGYCFINTGSPHYVAFESNLKKFDIIEKARYIRYNGRFREEGTNVNFISIENDKLNIRTYERGVEDETLACGTGVTAAVLAAHATGQFKGNELEVKALGGDLKVKFEKLENGYKNIWLEGPAEYVFKGVINA